MARSSWKLLSIACLIPAANAVAGEVPPPKPTKPAISKAWKPKWLTMKAPSENVHLVNTPSQRMFSPFAAVRITNHLRDEGERAKEILVGGHENNVVTLKLYQEENDRYTRVDFPVEHLREETTLSNGQKQLITMGMQGMGTSGKQLVVAGGSSSTHNNGYLPSARVFTVDAQTKKIRRLADLKTPRAMPMVGASPRGRFIVVAGGATLVGRSTATSTAIDMIDRVTGQHVDLATHFPGLAAGLPEGRYGGSIAWVQEPGVDRIFFIGGATVFNPAQQGGLLGQAPSKTIHYYDVPTQSWGSMELPTPRMGAAVAIRHLGDGRQEIVVAGGGTGTNELRRIDPQIYAVERIDPKHLTVKFGENLPEQMGLYTQQTERGSVALEWTPNAMVLTHAGHTQAGKLTVGARFFGFANAYKTDPVPATHREGGNTIVNVSNTTINETQINETVTHETVTNIRNDVRVNQTEIEQKVQVIR